MKKVALLLLALSSAAQAATGFFDNLYVVTSYNGGANVFRQVTTGTTPGAGAAAGHNLTPDGVNPSFTSWGNFENFNNLTLKGFEYKTFNDNGSNVTHANLFYRIYQGSPSGSFTQIQDTTAENVSGNNKTWQKLDGTTNILSGLGLGTYNIEIYTESYTNGVNTAGNIFGFSSNPVGTFTIIVPEPSRLMLVGLGALGLITRRRRK